MFGVEDQLLNNIGSMMRFWPVTLLLNSQRKIQPVYVDDVAEGIVMAIARPETAGRVYELAGPKVYTHEEFYRQIAEVLQANPRIWKDPPESLLKCVLLTNNDEKHSE